MKGFFSFIGLLFSLALAAWFFLTFVLVSDQQKIMRVLEQGRSYVERGSLVSLKMLLAPDYHHENGMDGDEMLASLHAFFQEAHERKVRLLRCDVQIEKDHAEVDLQVLLSGETTHANAQVTNMLNSSSTEALPVHVVLAKLGSSWKIQSTALRRNRKISH